MGRKEGLYKFFKLTLHIFGAVFLVLPLFLYAANYQTYPPNFEVTIGEFVYNDDFTATTDDCHVSVSDPSGSVVVNAVLMSADANGWHHYTFTPAATEGTWPAFISCGTIGVDLIKQDKTFIVSSSVSTTTIAASIWDVATSTLTDAGTVGRHINDTLNAPVGSVAASVNANTNSAIENASSSLFSTLPTSIWAFSGRTLTSFGSLVADVWAYGSRSLTTMGSLAADVWSAATRTLTGAGLDTGSLATLSDIETATSSVASVVNANMNMASTSIGSMISGTNALIGLIPGFPNLWAADLVSTQSVEAGKVYRAKVYTRNAGQQADSFAAPQITIYDVNRNVIVSNIDMTDVGTGIYEYTYTVAAGAVQGSWESSVSIQVESGQYINTNDFWQVAGSPAQVIINSISDLTVPSISANVTITNEGLSGYEYQYEWCVVSDINNTCGGGDDIFGATAAKYINPGEDFNTTLTATVPTAGNYYFKMIVYFGTDSSGASRSFTATSETVVTLPPPVGGGGGGGGAFPPSNPNLGNVISGAGVCSGADFNRDKKVNSVDFSILLAFWKTDYPFSNSCVDVNKDKKVNSVDFSILLSQWGTSGSVQN